MVNILYKGICVIKQFSEYLCRVISVEIWGTYKRIFLSKITISLKSHVSSGIRSRIIFRVTVSCLWLQPVSVSHCCRGKTQSRERRWPSGVTPEEVFLNLQFTGSSTTQRTPPRARWWPRKHRSQTPFCTTSQATWLWTFPKTPSCRAS